MDTRDPAAVRRQLERILASPVFARSARMGRFLRFTVESFLDGRGSDLKEYVIGTEVFDRGSGYDPRVDPIVRVEARRLRAKLRAYYQSEGRNDDLTIDFPTGSYAPVFRRATDEPARAPAGDRAIAVLPFANLGNDPDTEYFSDGLTEELIHRLTKLEGVRVVAWQSAARMKGREDDIREIGARLKVANVLTGSVRSSGNRLRITACLIDTVSGQYLWSESFDRELRDLFQIQDEIARAITSTLQVRLRGDTPVYRPTRDLEAYSFYLKGRFHWNKRTPAGMRNSIELYRQAIELDPEMAVAYAGIADAFTVMAEYGVEHPVHAMAQARAYAAKALALDPLLAEPHASLGLILSVQEWQWAEAEREYGRAIALDPNYAAARHWFAVDHLGALGRLPEATAQIEVARQLDPLSAIIAEGRGYLRLLGRDYEGALAAYREIRDIDPVFGKGLASAARAQIQLGRYQEALALLERAREFGGEVPSVLAAMGQAYGLAGNPDRARALLGELEAIRQRRYMPSTSFAIVCLGLHENERALDWLERGCADREIPMVSIRIHPVYDPLRGEPRFERLVAAVFGDAGAHLSRG